MIIKNKITRLVLFGLGIVIGYTGRGCSDDGKTVELNKTSSVEETLKGEVSGYYKICMKDRDNLDQKLTQKTQEYNTCTAKKDEFKQMAEAASQVSDSRYIAIKSAVDKGGDEGRNELINLIDNYVTGFEGAVWAGANGSCVDGLSNLYQAITPIKNDKVKHDFVVMLTEAGICNSFVPGSKYLNIEIEK
jgi:hypothetical protein